jgi:hypothetical protein
VVSGQEGSESVLGRAIFSSWDDGGFRLRRVRVRYLLSLGGELLIYYFCLLLFTSIYSLHLCTYLWSVSTDLGNCYLVWEALASCRLSLIQSVGSLRA